MPPKVASPEITSKPKKADQPLDDDAGLMWALICQFSSGGKLNGVNWESVTAAIGAPTKATTA